MGRIVLTSLTHDRRKVASPSKIMRVPAEAWFPGNSGCHASAEGNCPDAISLREPASTTGSGSVAGFA
jgi:hypothetical protein